MKVNIEWNSRGSDIYVEVSRHQAKDKSAIEYAETSSLYPAWRNAMLFTCKKDTNIMCKYEIICSCECKYEFIQLELTKKWCLYNHYTNLPHRANRFYL